MIRWEEIIIHHSASEDGSALDTALLRKYHKDRGWIDIGYHFIIELVGNDYEIIAGRMIDLVGAHCIGHNDIGIGICVVGNYEITKPHPKQVRLLIKLCKALCYQFNIPPSRIYSHNNFSNTLCPGKNLDVSYVVRQVTKEAILFNHYCPR
jgi:hypothetical protein